MYPSRQQQICFIPVTRKSSGEEQYRQHHSIDRQLNDLRKFTERNRAVQLCEPFVIKCTAKQGKNFETEEFKKVWKLARRMKGRVTHILWTDVNRYGRSSAGIYWFEKFQEIGIEVNFTEDWHDFSRASTIERFYAALGRAQAYIMQLGQDTCKGKAGLREAGYYNDTLPAPWKYEAERRIDGRKYAQIVPEAFEAYKIATLSFYQGSSQAAAMRAAKDQTGYKISSSAFSRWLLVPLAYGYLPIWDNYKIPIHARKMMDLIPCHNVPAMFQDLNMFYQIRDRVKEIAPGSAGKGREPFNADFPLSYPCPSCGGPTRSYYSNMKRPTPTPYYDCRKNCSREARVHRSKANQFIADFLTLIEINETDLALAKEGAKRALHKAGLGDAKAKEKLTKELQGVHDRIDYLHKNLTQYEPNVFSEAVQRLEIQRRRIELDITDLEQKKAAGLDVRSKTLDFIGNMGSWFLNEANGHQQARFMAAIFPEGYTISKKGFRTWYINRILESMATVPEGYIMKKGETGLFAPISPQGGRQRDRIRTLNADIIALQDFFASLKAA